MSNVFGPHWCHTNMVLVHSSLTKTLLTQDWSVAKIIHRFKRMNTNGLHLIYCIYIHLLSPCEANFSPLKPYIQQLVVATNETTRLPEDWLRWTGARQRRYTAQERDAWRRRAARRAEQRKREEERAESQVGGCGSKLHIRCVYDR